jgi:threonine/homoserine/homoserine lactone efflux protein
MLEFALAALVIELTPGPNMTWLAVLGSSRGRNAALAAVAGIAIGLSLAAAIAGTSLAAVFSQYPQLFLALRWLGTLYLLYLAWDAWRDADGASAPSASNARQAFRQGLITNILNPKAYLFYIAVLPNFVERGANVVSQLVLLSAIYVAIATSIHAGIALLSGSLADWLASSPQAVVIRKALAVIIAAASIWFFFSTGVMK